MSADARTAAELAALRHRRDAPAEDIALHLVFIINGAGSITQDSGSFDELERLYLAFARVISHAYGQRPALTPVRRRSRLANAS